MKKIFLYILPIILFFWFLLSCYAIINTGVSIKYEADDGCISSVDGTNLCRIAMYWKLSAVASVVAIAGIIFLNRKKGNRISN